MTIRTVGKVGFGGGGDIWRYIFEFLNEKIRLTPLWNRLSKMVFKELVGWLILRLTTL